MLKILLRVSDTVGESIFRNFGDIHICHLICCCLGTFLFFKFLTYLRVGRTLNLVVLGPEICDEKNFLFWKLTRYRGIKFIKFASYCKRITYNTFSCLDAGYIIFIFILVYYRIYLLQHF